MTMLKHLISALLMILIGSVGTVQAGTDIAVIVHPDNSIDSIDLRELRRIFLGKRKSFANQQPARPVIQTRSQLADSFNLKVVRRSTLALRAYWSKMLFSGGGALPIPGKDDQSVKKIVAGNPQAIGYIATKNIDSNIKVVLTFTVD